ncbi:WD40/YVTN/BNR-like repeat-containing protein [Ectopseudomonas guguanensis]|uniref:Photosynthesis system II assembly factor Ycf48/Hcf136-like domain-containing protein n=1 Tax=Ectopseudomonas guguanensis TaxID=1198456 RepID=A0A1H0VRE2_9GAMM|nr:YCF48-related protein [Pseudomonas guguanensis]SDP81179.1 Uncharacterized protein SAMN05216213_10634 [Pseudomonas guguanensis]
MNMFKGAALVALIVAVALPFTREVVAAANLDVLDTPATYSPLATQGILTGIARAGTRLVVVGQRGHILYSDDAGQQWQQAQVPVSSDLVAVHFPTASLGWAVGHDGVVLHSSDAGATWLRQLDGRRIGALMLQHYQRLAALRPEDDALAAWIEEAQRMEEQGADKPFLDVWFADERDGYVVGAFGLILKTEDGGRSWHPLLERVDNPSLLHLYAIRPVGEELFVVGEQGLVLRLDRSAQRFTAIPMPYNGSFFGILGKPGVVIAYGLRGNVFRSTDGGANWSKVETGLELSITAGTVIADGRMVLFTQSGHPLVSSDDGASFQPAEQSRLLPVSAATESGTGSLVLAGPRGVRLLPFE